MRSAAARVLLLALAMAVPGASALDADEMFDDPVRERRAREIGKQLRCMVCQNQSIFDSNASLARDLRMVVRSRMDAGDSDQQVLAYVSQRFGDFVLLEPPVRGVTAALWAAPVLMLVLALGGGWLYLRRMAHSRAASEDAR